jgi:hypothetical protein
MLFNGILSKAVTGALAKTGSNLTAEAGLGAVIDCLFHFKTKRAMLAIGTWLRSPRRTI